MFAKMPNGNPKEEHVMLRYLLNSMLPEQQTMMKNKNRLDELSPEEMLKGELQKMEKEQKVLGITRQLPVR